MQQPVGRHRAAAVGGAVAGEVGEPPAGLLHDHEQRREVPEGDDRLGRDVGRALGDEDVLQKSPKPRVRQTRWASASNSSCSPYSLPPLDVAVAELRVLERRATFDTRIGAPSANAPPPRTAHQRVPERGRGHDADAQLAVLLEREQRRPDRHAADVVLGAVDRVDDPPAAASRPRCRTPRRGPRRPGRAACQPVADQLLGRVVGLGDRGEVGLGLDLQVVRAEAAQRDLVGVGGELEGEGEIGVDAATLVGWCHGASDERCGMLDAIARRCPCSRSPRRRHRSWSSAVGADARRVRRRLGQGEQPAPVDDHARASTHRRRRFAERRDRRPPCPRRRRPPRRHRTTVGTCGNQTDAIVAAINGADARRARTRAPVSSRCRRCRIAASSPIWAAAQIVPEPRRRDRPRYTVVLQRIGALWNVMDVGDVGHSGCDAPSEIRSDLGLGC